MENSKTPFLDQWPKVSFDELENIEIKNPPTRIFYKSFFVLFFLPEKIFKSFEKLKNFGIIQKLK